MSTTYLCKETKTYGKHCARKGNIRVYIIAQQPLELTPAYCVLASTSAYFHVVSAISPTFGLPIILRTASIRVTVILKCFLCCTLVWSASVQFGLFKRRTGLLSYEFDARILHFPYYFTSSALKALLCHDFNPIGNWYQLPPEWKLHMWLMSCLDLPLSKYNLNSVEHEKE